MISTPQALSNPTQNQNIIISPANKSDGLIIMHKQRYVEKINSLPEDTNTNEISHLTTIKQNITSFDKLFKIS